MLYIGKNVFQNKLNTQAPKTLAAAYQMISQPTPQLDATVRTLRKLRSLDPQRYRDCKRYLPYFIGAKFRHGIKRISHFSSILHFVIDIDGDALEKYRPADLRDKLSKDPRVALAFISPGGEGVKLVFSLATAIRNAHYFTAFYRAFTAQFFEENDLPPLADTSTCDVTRICFLSVDAHARFRPHAERIQPEAVLTKTDWQTAEAQRAEATEDPSPIESPATPTPASPLDEKLIQQIKARLDPKYRPRGRVRQVYVPPIMETVRQPLVQQVTQHGILLSEIRDIHYGHKYIFTVGGSFAELNIYHGMRGFTVVKSAKRGHHAELTEIVYLLCSEKLEQIEDGQQTDTDHEKVIAIRPEEKLQPSGQTS